MQWGHDKKDKKWKSDWSMNYNNTNTMPNYNINNNDKETKKRPLKIHYERQLMKILNADKKQLSKNTFCCWSKCHPRVDEQTPLHSVNLMYHSTAAIIIRCHQLLLYHGLKKPGCHKSLTCWSWVLLGKTRASLKRSNVMGFAVFMGFQFFGWVLLDTTHVQ